MKVKLLHCSCFQKEFIYLSGQLDRFIKHVTQNVTQNNNNVYNTILFECLQSNLKRFR